MLYKKILVLVLCMSSAYKVFSTELSELEYGTIHALFAVKAPVDITFTVAKNTLGKKKIIASSEAIRPIESKKSKFYGMRRFLYRFIFA